MKMARNIKTMIKITKNGEFCANLPVFNRKKGIAGFARNAKKYIGGPKNKFAITCQNYHTRNEIQKYVIIGVRKR